VLAGAAERQQDKALGARVDELAAHTGRDAHCALGVEHVLDALDHQRQLTGEHEIDLLLAVVRVDAPTLARREQQQVDAEGAHAELATQRLKALRLLVVECRECDVVVSHRASIGPRVHFRLQQRLLRQAKSLEGRLRIGIGQGRANDLAVLDLEDVHLADVGDNTAALSSGIPARHRQDVASGVDELLDVGAEVVKCLFPLIPDRVHRGQATPPLRRIRRMSKINPLHVWVIVGQSAVAVAAFQRLVGPADRLYVLLRHRLPPESLRRKV
jgi:hypothetical protein